MHFHGHLLSLPSATPRLCRSGAQERRKRQRHPLQLDAEVDQHVKADDQRRPDGYLGCELVPLARYGARDIHPGNPHEPQHQHARSWEAKAEDGLKVAIVRLEPASI